MYYLRKPVTFTKPLVYLSKVKIHIDEHVSGIRRVPPCVIHKQDAVNVTVHSVFSDVNYG